MWGLDCVTIISGWLTYLSILILYGEYIQTILSLYFRIHSTLTVNSIHPLRQWFFPDNLFQTVYFVFLMHWSYYIQSCVYPTFSGCLPQSNLIFINFEKKNIIFCFHRKQKNNLFPNSIHFLAFIPMLKPS